MSEYAIYKGRTYKLRWRGDTRYGERAKLAFLDGSKEFWVDVSAIEETDNPPSSYSRGYGDHGKHWGRCWECGCEGWLDQDDYCGC